MFGQEDQDGDQIKLLEELELNQPKAVSASKGRAEQELRVTIFACPGNASQRRDEYRIQGTTALVGKTSLTASFSRAHQVGDIYQISFDREQLDVAHRNLERIWAACNSRTKRATRSPCPVTT